MPFCYPSLALTADRGAHDSSPLQLQWASSDLIGQINRDPEHEFLAHGICINVI